MTTTQETRDLSMQMDESQPEEYQSRDVNVGNTERVLSIVGGGALAAYGIGRRSIPGLILAGVGAGLLYRGSTGHCPMYTSLDMDTTHDDRAEPHEFFKHGIHVEQAYTINKPREELYRFWRNFENLPRFMNHLEAVRCLDGNRSHWVVKAPAGTTVEWDAEIINEEENSTIAWRSLQGADVDNAGSVRFIEAPAGRGTEVKVVIEYLPPAGKLGSIVAKLFGEEPGQQIQDDLRRFKNIMEAGEVPTIEGQSRGVCAR